MRTTTWGFLCYLSTCVLVAQVGPFPSTSFPLVSVSQQMARVPAGANPTLLNITVDAPPAGQETMDVLVGDPNVVISLILPGGSEITAANAASNGFSFLTYTTDGSGTSEDLWSPFSTSGTHTVIQFPAPAPAGVYAVQANAAAAQGDTAMIVMYYPSSTVSLGSVTDAGTYRQGDFVILSGLVFDGTTPIQNATVTAVAGTFLNLNGTIGNYQLTNVTQINSTISQYTYSVQLTNAGAAANNVVASVSTTDPNMTFVQDTVAFGSVGAGATVTGGNPFSFLYPTASSYSLSTLQWTVQAPGAPINVTLLDSGTYDHATGDGIYTGTFTPAVPGNYIVQVTASGTSAAGLPFVRTASTTFHVITPAGQLGAFSDTLGTDPFSGQILGVNITASVNILTAGQYQLTMQLTSSNGHTVQGSGSAQLGAGSGQIVVTFTASQLLTLGVNGPYTMANARLILATPTDSIFADYKDPAGTTQAYVLNSFNPPGLQFTGPYSSTPVDNNGTPGYEVLTIGIGITPLSGYYGYCQSNGALYAGSTQIDSASSMQFYSNGTSSVALNFSGYHIRNAGLNGPYMLRNATVICGNSQVTGDNLFQTPAYTASQFENSVGDFSLSGPTNVTATAATPANIKVDISRIAGLNQSIQFTLNGAPAGSAPTLYFPAVQSAPLINVVIFPGTASAGSYPLTITGASGALSHSVNVTLIIPGVAAPTFNPPAGTYSSAQSVTIGTTTSGASIRYTTDLSIPSETAGTLFTGSPVKREIGRAHV